MPIHAALVHHDTLHSDASDLCSVHIYTDSLASIYAIKNAIFNPHRNSRKLHTEVLAAIASIIVKRAERHQHTHIHKVKSHVQIEGNERADAAAKHAAQLSTTSYNFSAYDYTAFCITIPTYWPYTNNPPGERLGSGSPPPVSCGRRYLRNPRKDISELISAHSLKLFPPHTLYGTGLQADLPLASVKHRELAWGPNISDPQKRTLIRTITGQILNFKLINRYTTGKIPPHCPLCGQLDSVAHIVCGGCNNHEMKSRTIKRHDNAVRTLLAATLRGNKGNHALAADVNTDDANTTDTSTETPCHGSFPIPKRLPTHLLSALRARLASAMHRTHTLSDGPPSSHIDSTICHALHTQFCTDGEDFPSFRARFDCNSVTFRPDIVMFEGGAHGSETTWRDPAWTRYRGKRVIHVVELGYAREGRAYATQTRKRSQHAVLALLLSAMQWTVHYHTITLGVTGTIYHDAVAAMTALGIPPSAQSHVISAWVHMTLNHTHGLVTQRRSLDAHLIAQAFQLPP